MTSRSSQGFKTRSARKISSTPFFYFLSDKKAPQISAPELAPEANPHKEEKMGFLTDIRQTSSMTDVYILPTFVFGFSMALTHPFQTSRTSIHSSVSLLFVHSYDSTFMILSYPQTVLCTYARCFFFRTYLKNFLPLF